MPNQNDIESFLASYPPKSVSSLMRPGGCWGNVTGAEETLDQSARVIGFGYGPGYKGCVCTLIMSQKVSSSVSPRFRAARPKGLLGGSGKVHRHVALQTLADLKQPGLKPLIKAALAAWKERTKADG